MKNLYSVYDQLSGFMGPVVDLNDDVAIRNFSYMICNSKEYTVNAKDYSLYCVGTFDDTTGELVSHVPPHFLVRASSVLPIE